MDGRVGAVRKALDEAGYDRVRIMSYAAKYASCFFAPFRDAIGTASSLGSADKRVTYQDGPRQRRRGASARSRLDIAEGADMVMVKPGLPFLDMSSAASRTCLPHADLRLPGLRRILDDPRRRRTCVGSTASAR